MSDPRSMLEQEKARFVQADGAFERLLRRRDRKRRNERIEAGTLAIVVMLVAAVFLLHAFPLASGPEPAVRPTITPTIGSEPPAWFPVREAADQTVHSGLWHDPQDSAVDWVDISSARYTKQGQPRWDVWLAAMPPLAKRLEPGTLIAYGLVLDTTADGIADYLIGIDNDAPKRGDLHVWLTDLATGRTEQQIGPPYGFPIEFRNPLEHEPGTASYYERYGPLLNFTFLDEEAPADLYLNPVRFYVWASETRDGEVVAWDLAPDDGWISARHRDSAHRSTPGRDTP